MYSLLHTNVDGYPSIRDQWTEKPSRDELYETLIPYHSEQEANDAADELLKYGEASIGDANCTVYTLEST